MKINNNPLFPTYLKPNLICWGCHEESKGTRWIEINSQGVLVKRDYQPNSKGITTIKQTKQLAAANFDAILSIIRQVTLAEVDFSAAPQSTILSLECIGEDLNYRLLIPPDELKTNTKLQQIASLFMKLESIKSTT